MYNWKRNMTGPEVIQELEANGWVFDSIRGSHHKYKRNGVSCPVPVHGNDTLTAFLPA
ncbi:MAG: type II toxin-antitoxin system HicA family toxin [Hymenobacter sp.]|nr:MAG: type II toxin-antitoxin system HicA family toxin [Hymenobacter sp.]